ncbi:MAG: hypothetical protein DMF41_03515, partial [Verrucomicrobia bacterium]
PPLVRRLAVGQTRKGADNKSDRVFRVLPVQQAIGLAPPALRSNEWCKRHRAAIGALDGGRTIHRLMCHARMPAFCLDKRDKSKPIFTQKTTSDAKVVPFASLDCTRG